MKLKSHYYRDGTTLCGQGRISMGARLFDTPVPPECKSCLHIIDNERAAAR